MVAIDVDKQFRINNPKHFAGKREHMNGMEAFWRFTKRSLSKFTGGNKNFERHIKECGWRCKKTLRELIANLKTLVSNYK